jgi:hypothetical protein
VLDLIEELRSIITALEAARVEFAVCGGLAVAIHVAPRATLDVDLLLPSSQLERCKEIAHGLGYEIATGPIRLSSGAVEIHPSSPAAG